MTPGWLLDPQADARRLINVAVAGYIVIELAVIVYLCLWIARGY